MSDNLYNRFRRIEQQFNKNYLTILDNCLGIIVDEDDYVQQYNELQNAYNYWYSIITENACDSSACLQFYDAIGDYHEMLLKSNQQVFVINGDLLSNMFKPAKGYLQLKTPEIFDLLGDGLDDCDGEQTEDYKDNLWQSLQDLYRLCVLLCAYIRTPLVKEIIDIILLQGSDINLGNLTETMKKQFYGNTKSSRRLRRLMKKLTEQKESDFENIIKSLKKVISVVAPNLETTMNKMMPMQMSSDSLKEYAPNASQQELDAMFELVQMPDVEHVDGLSDENLSIIRSKLQTSLPSYNAMNESMDTMMNAMKDPDNADNDETMNKLFDQLGNGLNLNKQQLEKMKEEMSSLEEDIMNTEIEDSDDEEEEKK